MSFRRTYDEIRELLVHEALDPDVARDIVRKSGLMSGTGGGGDDGTQLGEQLYNPPPFSRARQLPRRRVQNSVAWPYPVDPTGSPPDENRDGVTFWDFRGGDRLGFATESSMDTTDDIQTRWNAMHFPGFSSHRQYRLGGYLVPPGHNTAGEHAKYGTCWVRGSSVYNPFPFPDAPLYFWADLSRARGINPFYGRLDVGYSVDPISNTSVSGSTPVNAVGSMVFKVWGSIDNGTTWTAPRTAGTVSGVTNPGTGHWAQQVNPSYTPTDPAEDGYVSASTTTGAELKEEFKRDDVLLKFTLESDPGNWLEYEYLGFNIKGRQSTELTD